MSAHDPASSFGAPGGASAVFSWATALSREDPATSTSRIRKATRVAALFTRSILTRTRCSPLPLTGRTKHSPSAPPTTTPVAPDDGILHERSVPYHLSKSISVETAQ